jgi:hypothetical protein
MVLRLGKLYARRIVNVNVNIVAAGLLALLPTVGLVHFMDGVGLTSWTARRLGVDAEFVVNAVTLVSDVVCDVGIYFCLHWLANHWPRRAAQKLHLPQPHPIHPTFFKDATMVQVERMMLSPLLYLLWLGIQHMLLIRGVSLTHATVAGGVIGIGTTRFLHTLWMIRQQRRWAKKAEAAAAGARCPKCAAILTEATASACPQCGCDVRPPVAHGASDLAPETTHRRPATATAPASRPATE